MQRRASVIFAPSPPAARAAKAATATIPIVFIMGEDPIREGLVASLSRPGDNITGFSDFRNQLAAKRLQLLHETIPKANVIGLLINPTNPNATPDSKDMEEAVAAIGQKLRVFNAKTDQELEPAFAEIARSRIEALVVNVDILFRGRTREIAALAARYAIPAIYEWREFAIAGGLMSYGTGDGEGARLMAGYIADASSCR